MEILGVRFVPLSVSLRTSLETLAVSLFVFVIAFGGFIGIYSLVYVTFYTRFWPVALAYIIWTYVIDRDISERGGRRLEWVRGWSWWRYVHNYFPVSLTKVQGCNLDPMKNYIFCCFPHGVLPIGPYANFGYKDSNYPKLFPNHTVYNMTLRESFYIPVLRELVLSMAACSVTKDSFNWLLGSPTGGKVLILIVGGSAESFYARPGQYRVILKNRKGFVKQAMKYGTSLVPVISFGETDIFDQVVNPRGSLIRNIQEWIKSVTGYVPIILLGRGIFQNTPSIIPFRKPISTIVGRPIEVAKIDNPTQDQLDAVHEEFTKKLINLFEEQKHNYLSNAQNVSLIIE